MTKIWDQISALTLPMIAAFLAGSAAAGVVIWYCASYGSKELALVALVCAIAGWIVGLLAAPTSLEEERHFSQLATAVSGFITGYVLSKVDPTIQYLFEVQEQGLARVTQPPYSQQVLVGLASFGIALLFVFNARLYWRGDPKPDKTDTTVAKAADPATQQPDALSAMPPGG
jgi:lysylphosphatidylglycerol synthetase-like protein (DUF2156 family)